MIRAALIVFAISALGAPVWAQQVDCTGWNSQTQAYVYGTCSNGDFSGWDSRTHAYVYGNCQIGGNLQAWDSQTHAYVYGSCSASTSN